MINVAKFKNLNKCDVCGKCFGKPALLRRHLVVHSTEKPFKCETCSSCFSQKSSLQRHLRSKHDVANESDDSTVAQHALAALKQLQASHTSHNVDPPREKQPSVELTLEEQPTCDVVLLRDNLHPNGEVHILTTQRILRQKSNRCFYVCEYCGKEFGKSYDLIRHRRTHTKETPYPCGRCIKRFATRSKLNEHHRRQHAKLKKHACSECSASYSSKSKLQKHLSQQHSHLIYNCTHCNSSFATKAACDAHMKRETDPQVAKLSQLLPQPVITERSYKCVYCAKLFKRKFNCRSHMLLHLRRLLDENHMRHGCLQCGKYFQKPNDLARHLLTHSKLKLHQCPLCQKQFTLKSTLARHLETHQSKRSSVICQVCGKSYSSQASLRLHLRLHTGERPFSCEICGQTFRTSGHRLEHMRAERHKPADGNSLIL